MPPMSFLVLNNISWRPSNLNFDVSGNSIMAENHMRLFLCILFFTSTCADADDPTHISINCGATAASTARSGRQWLRDAAPRGSSTASTITGGLVTAVDPVPYKTSRISTSAFSYSFPTAPGQKIIRLHFNPGPYYGFKSTHDLFTVEAGSFTLLANFSASITALSLNADTLAKEFCIIVHENQPLNIVFSPETSQSKYINHAFINGIEIISVPSTLAYCQDGGSAVHVLGQEYAVYVDSTTALEIVHRRNIKWASATTDDATGGLLGMWASTLVENANEASLNRSWRVAVDVGFRYLVRLHLCELGLKLHKDFMLLINNVTALNSSAGMLQQRALWYNYMLIVEGQKREGKREISVSLHSPREFLDRYGPFEGFEIFKLSNHDRSLASPNPPPARRGDSPSQSRRQAISTHLLYSLLGRMNANATLVIFWIIMACIMVYLVRKLFGPNFPEEENKPSARARGLCRRFSLAEMESATDTFHERFVIGRGGYGKVYKGCIGKEGTIVAIKRLKRDSKQGEHEFWTEVETLSELNHANVISLIGYCYCVEKHEMILVYEYMPHGTLADHLYKLARKNDDFCPLPWKQRLHICIGSARALDYLHTGLFFIHRDIKASNILLDEKFEPKVSDLGLAKTGTGIDQDHSTRVRGTDGYMDPHYYTTRKVSNKSDTYSFGVVLLEALCGRAAILEQYDDEEEEEDKRSLTAWAMDNISKGQVDDIVDPCLRGEISPECLKTFVKIAERCLHGEPKERPAAAYVVVELELALQQQEMINSTAAAAGDHVFSSTQKSPDNVINAGLPTSICCTDIPREQSNFNSTVIKDGRNSMMRRISRKLWPWDGFWRNRKTSTY